MIPLTDNRQHVRELIRSFARLDEYFDSSAYDEADQMLSWQIHGLNYRLGLLLSCPVKEGGDELSHGKEVLNSAALRHIELMFPADIPEQEIKLGRLREIFRDQLYEFLLRIDHCSPEQMLNRNVCVSSRVNLSLAQLNQLVVHLTSRCLENIFKARLGRNEGDGDADLNL